MTDKKNSGRIPVMTDEFKEKVVKNLIKNEKFYGIYNTKTEANKVADSLKKKRLVVKVEKNFDQWVVITSKINWKEM
jgi:hypothetical protein